MIKPKFNSGYARPTCLSDPHQDNLPECLEALLAREDSQLNRVDFSVLLGPYLPAGTYLETIYFLPFAFSYVKANPSDALDLVTPLFWYCSENFENLKKDGLIENVRSAIKDYFSDLTEKFEVIHFDKEASRLKGWQIDYFDYVVEAEAVVEGIVDLVRFEKFADLALEVIKILRLSGNPHHHAWYLELVRTRLNSADYNLPDHKEITKLLLCPTDIRRARSIVEATVIPFEKSPTYWPDTLKIINVFLDDEGGAV